jgi:hypothetical protein
VSRLIDPTVKITSEQDWHARGNKGKDVSQGSQQVNNVKGRAEVGGNQTDCRYLDNQKVVTRSYEPVIRDGRCNEDGHPSSRPTGWTLRSGSMKNVEALDIDGSCGECLGEHPDMSFVEVC